MENKLIYFLLFCILHISQGVENGTLHEKDLHKYLFEDYNPDVFPNLSKSEPLVMNIEMFLMAIENIDEKRQTITVRVFMELSWTDDFLKWDRDIYSGVKSINVQNDFIWIPDISLAGTLDKPLDIGQKDGRAVVDHTGKIIIWPYKTHTIACNISVANFPLDKQTCQFDFSFWTNPSSVLRLRNPSGNVQMGYFTESGEWTLVSTEKEVYQKPYGNDTYDHIIFRLNLKRKWMFHALNTMAPVICISVLNLFCFLLPTQSGERVTLCISIFLTLAVFLTVVNNSMPESSNEVAIFGVYIGLQLVGSALNIIATVVAIYFFHKDNAIQVPCLLRHLTKLCCGAAAKEHKETRKVSHGEYYCHTKLVQENHITDNSEIEPEVVNDVHVTWAEVSVALDRLGLVCAICWHSCLICFLLIGINLS